IRRGAEEDRRRPDHHRLRACVRLAHHRRDLRRHMLVSASPAALRFSADTYARRERDAERELRSPRSAFALSCVFLEIGAGYCALARRAAGFVERVYAVDICE